MIKRLHGHIRDTILILTNFYTKRLLLNKLKFFMAH